MGLGPVIGFWESSPYLSSFEYIIFTFGFCKSFKCNSLGCILHGFKYGTNVD